jgi:hypothetical protein
MICRKFNIWKDSLYPDVLPDELIAVIQEITIEDHESNLYQWSRMYKYFIAPPGLIMIERFKPYIWISYDYSFDGIKYYSTTHFKEFISLN